MVGGEIDPVGVDVEFHCAYRAGANEEVREVSDVETRTTHVDECPVGVIPMPERHT